MPNLIGNLINGNMKIDDETIATSMLGAAKEGADMYLNATLTSSTPELRALYAASLSQMVEGHTALTELEVSKGWIRPYDPPVEQLSSAYKSAKEVIK